MPHYFFDVSNGHVIRDTVGCNADDKSTMHTIAYKIASDAIEAQIASGGDPDIVNIFVRNSDDRRVLTLHRNIKPYGTGPVQR